MNEPVDKRISAAALPFLQGRNSVLDFRSEFGAAARAIIADRPLRGFEIELFDLLERWETQVFDDRADTVDQLRLAARRATAASQGPEDPS